MGNSIDWDELPDEETGLWKPTEVGDKLHGVLIDFTWQNGKGGKTPVLTLATEEGQRTWWAGQRDAKAKLKSANVQLNDILTVEYTDEIDTGAPSPMKVFRVEVDREKDEAF
jgi:hypothetical protein